MNRARRILNRAIRAKSDPPMPPRHPPMPPGGLSWGAFVRVACVTPWPLGHAWLGHPGAPGHVCRGQPWGPSSRSTARAPPPLGAWLPRPGARPPLYPRPPVILPSNGVHAPAPPSAPAPTRHTPCCPGPLLTVTHGCAHAAPRATPIPWTPAASHRPQPPEPADPDPLVARPPFRLSVRGGQETAGEGHAPSTFSRNARAPRCPPTAPASRSDFPRLPHDTRTAHALFA